MIPDNLGLGIAVAALLVRILSGERGRHAIHMQFTLAYIQRDDLRLPKLGRTDGVAIGVTGLSVPIPFLKCPTMSAFHCFLVGM